MISAPARPCKSLLLLNIFEGRCKRCRRNLQKSVVLPLASRTWVFAKSCETMSPQHHVVMAEVRGGPSPLVPIALNEPSQRPSQGSLPLSWCAPTGCGKGHLFYGGRGCFFLTFILPAVFLPNSEDPEDPRYWA